MILESSLEEPASSGHQVRRAKGRATVNKESRTQAKCSQSSSEKHLETRKGERTCSRASNGISSPKKGLCGAMRSTTNKIRKSTTLEALPPFSFRIFSSIPSLPFFHVSSFCLRFSCHLRLRSRDLHSWPTRCHPTPTTSMSSVHLLPHFPQSINRPFSVLSSLQSPSSIISAPLILIPISSSKFQIHSPVRFPPVSHRTYLIRPLHESPHRPLLLAFLPSAFLTLAFKPHVETPTLKRTERDVGHGHSEDHRHVERTTPLLGYQHRRSCTETVDDGVDAFFLEATHVHAGDVDPSVCESVVVLSVSRVEASEIASGSVVPPLHLIGAATADGARMLELAQGDTGVDGVSTSTKNNREGQA